MTHNGRYTRQRNNNTLLHVIANPVSQRCTMRRKHGRDNPVLYAIFLFYDVLNFLNYKLKNSDVITRKRFRIGNIRENIDGAQHGRGAITPIFLGAALPPLVIPAPDPRKNYKILWVDTAGIEPAPHPTTTRSNTPRACRDKKTHNVF